MEPFGMVMAHGIVIAIVIMAIAFAIYFLPTFIAFNRRHHNRLAIFGLNLLLGWTFFGWVGAFIWALTAVRPELAH